MKGIKRITKSFIFAVTLLFIFTTHSQAANFDQALGAAIENLPGDADIAGWGGAGVGAPVDFSSENPAVLDGCREKAFGFSVTPGYISGLSARIYGASTAVKLPIGTLQLSYEGGNSSSIFLPKEGVDFKIDRSNSATIQYGVKAAEKVFGSDDKMYAGIGATPFSETKTSAAVEGINVLKSTSREYAFSFGTHYENKSLNAGIFYEYSHSSTKTDYGAEGKEKENSESHLFRAGASYKVLDILAAIVNYQYANTDGYVTSRIYGGAEFCPFDYACAYVGHNGSGPTGGLGIYPAESWGVNLAYVDNLDKELKDQLGKKPSVFMISIFSYF